MILMIFFSYFDTNDWKLNFEVILKIFFFQAQAKLFLEKWNVVF